MDSRSQPSSSGWLCRAAATPQVLAVSKICCSACTWGVAAALHSQPLELGWLRESIRTRLSDGAYPHLLLRVGMVTQAAVSVRRPPYEVLPGDGGEEVNADDG